MFPPTIIVASVQRVFTLSVCLKIFITLFSVSSFSDSETVQNGSINRVANGMPESNDNEIAVSSGETSHNPEGIIAIL